MKNLMLALGFGLMLSSAVGFAQVPQSLQPLLTQHGVWHCTAYPEGHGHTQGYSYVDAHYNHAYYGAMNRCEAATHHHCHDVHCHFDHH